LLRACYGRAGRAGNIYSWGKRIDAESAREVYYRARGRAFNSVPPPKLYAGAARWSILEEEFTWDQDQGGDAVAGRVKQLNAVSSRQDAVIDPVAALAYVEWTLEFKNDGMLEREARAQVQLPPGGVVSRLTLWINGEEREAAFGGRSQVKAAYKEVVARRRDPVLVTTCGPDRVLVQCFPVPRDGGRMKTRIGFTVPLTLTDLENGYLRLPHFLERNFSLGQEFHHSLWVESKGALSSSNGSLIVEPSKAGGSILRGEITEPALSSGGLAVRVKRSAAENEAWAIDTRQENRVVKQRIEELPKQVPGRVVLVLDTTAGMDRYWPSIARALETFPVGIEMNVVFARDGARTLWTEPSKVDEISLREAGRVLRRAEAEGGHDNLPALLRAWDIAAQGDPAVILWVHGPQPVVIASPEDLRQRFERSAVRMQLLDFQVLTGPNRLAEQMDGLPGISSVIRLGDVESDLKRVFAGWSKDAKELRPVREQVAWTGERPPGAESSLHLARLWAAGEVVRLAKARRVEEAMRLAAAYQLVTPVSGAVVLETQEQYDRAGLKPVSADSVPSIPEPSGFALLVLGLLALLGWRKRTRVGLGASRV
jgi:hypothetical protein